MIERKNSLKVINQIFNRDLLITYVEYQCYVDKKK